MPVRTGLGAAVPAMARPRGCRGRPVGGRALTGEVLRLDHLVREVGVLGVVPGVEDGDRGAGAVVPTRPGLRRAGLLDAGRRVQVDVGSLDLRVQPHLLAGAAGSAAGPDELVEGRVETCFSTVTAVASIELELRLDLQRRSAAGARQGALDDQRQSRLCRRRTPARRGR